MKLLKISVDPQTETQIEWLRQSASQASGREITVDEVIAQAINDVACAVSEAMAEKLVTAPLTGDLKA